MTETTIRTDIAGIRRAAAQDAKGPGKFEGEAIYVPYFWGNPECADEDRGRALGFTVTDEDILIFPELAGRIGETIWLEEDDYGFVSELTGPPDEEEDEEEPEPDEEDCFISDRTRGGYDVSCGRKFIGNYPDWDSAYDAIRAWQDANEYWPNIWSVDDHGGHELID